MIMSRRYRHVESLPLMNSNQDMINDPTDVSDEDLDSLMHTPLALEGVLEHMRYHPHTVTRQQCYRGTLFFSMLSLVVGLLVSYLSCGFLCDLQNHKLKITELSGTEITSKIIKYTDSRNIEAFLRNLTQPSLLSGISANRTSVDYVAETWKEQGLEVKIMPYEVLLSYPKKNKPNKVSIVSGNQVIFSSSDYERLLHSHEEEIKDMHLLPFVAYSNATNGTIAGELIYANYGRLEDFKYLTLNHIGIVGKIALIRCGKAFQGNKVHLAEEYGVKAVILYCDPADYIPKGAFNVYSNSEYLLPFGVRRGTLLVEDGDPTTPFYPSIKSAYRVPSSATNIPRIPTHVISYSDATELFRWLGGPEAPDSWKGKLNVTYHLGPGFINSSLKLQMEVNTYNVMKRIYNVIGTIMGKEEPDRYVIVGSHRDAWIFGGTDPSSGTASMLELTRVFHKIIKEGWRPRRSIVFCSWGAEEYGLIGSTEWVEENQKQLISQTVAYLNMDTAVTGNYSMQIKSVPLLHRIVLDTAKKIPNPNQDEIMKGRLSVYDTWLWHFKQNSAPLIENIGAGSDSSPFLYNLGISSADFIFCKEKLGLDRESLKYNKAHIQLWAESTRALADSLVLPFSLSDVATTLSALFSKFHQQYKEDLIKCNISLAFINEAIKKFTEATITFEESLKKVDIQNPLAVRAVNDIMMQLERAFIDYRGLPGREYYRHVIYAPDSTNNEAMFGGLSDLLHLMQGMNQYSELHEKAQQHIAAIAFHIHSATKLLSQEL